MLQVSQNISLLLHCICFRDITGKVGGSDNQELEVTVCIQYNG